MNLWHKLLPGLLLGLLLLPLFFLPEDIPPQAGEPHLPDDNHYVINLTPDLSVFQAKDSSPKSIQDLLATQSTGQWQANTSTYVNRGFVSETHWVSLPLENTSSLPKDLVLEFRQTRIQSVSLYLLDYETKSYRSIYSQQGLTTPFSERKINYRNIATNLVLPAHSKSVLYWKIEHKGDLRFQIFAWSPKQFLNHAQQEQFIFGVIYGLLGFIILYNLYIAVNLKEITHFYFTLFATATALMINSYEGHLDPYLQDAGSLSHQWLFPILIAFVLMSFAMLASRFLMLKKWSDPLYVGVLLSSTSSALLFIVSKMTISPLYLSVTAIFLSIVLYGLAFFAASKLYLRGTSCAGYFGAGILAMILTIIYGALVTQNIIGTTQLPCSFITYGFVSMLLLLSLAMADKVRILHAERVMANMELIKLTEDKLNSNLELYKNKMQQLELEKLTDQETIETRAKSEFLATMSHEIRTPMSGMLGMTELLMDTNLSQKQLSYVQSISNSGQTLLSVINDLLDYSKVEAGKMEVDSLPFNLEDLVDDCISIFALKAAEKNLNFVASIKPETTTNLRGDSNKIRQILLNLLNNAWKFTDHGDITLYIYQTQKSSINSVEIRCEVKGTDINLNDEEMESLLQPFAQIETSSRKYCGAGLGLALCKEFAELMHGDIGVSNDPESGTVFWFSARFPLPHKNELTPRSNRAVVLQGKHLLVVDDHLPFCDLVTSLTTSWGMVTDISHQLADAEQKLKQSADEQNPYDLVILPWQARSEADETLHKALNEGRFGYKPTLIGSIHSRYLQSETPQSAGFSKFLTKPVTSKQLHNTLAESLGAVIQNTDSESQQPSYHYTKLRVLVAEDNKVNMMVIEGLLNKLRIRPLCAHNGEEALTLYKKATEPFDLILMDCEMPKVDGYDASRLIRQYEQEHQQQRTLIVALSAHTTPEYKEKAFAAGMDDYITKPVSKEQIEQILDQYYPQTQENPTSKTNG